MSHQRSMVRYFVPLNIKSQRRDPREDLFHELQLAQNYFKI